ncbi:MAG: xanthine dehydrogenase [Candidatus Eisenbacteria bacterium]|nr:xanthine dehydrogenase [Candidatus Eisenbacteria bacterium]
MIAEVLRAAVAAIDRGESFAMVTVVEAVGSAPGKPGHKMIVFGDGRQEGTVGGGSVEARAREAAQAMLAQGRGGILSYSLDPETPLGIDSPCGGKVTLAVEVVAAAVRMLLCGGGHVSQAFARVAAELRYRAVVADERAELLRAERFPAAAELVCESPEAYIERTGLDRFSHVVIFTHDHHLDREILRRVAQSGYAGYVGMIGSRRKWAQTREALEAEGIDPDWLSAVHCPVGLDIGAQSPAEIAVAMAGEIIQERRRS